METNTKKKEPVSIKIEENLPFESDVKTKMVSTTEMVDVVSAFFSSAFEDYVGCNIRVNDGSAVSRAVASSMPFGAIYVDLFFQDHGTNTGRIKNLVPHGTPTGDTGAEVSKLQQQYMKLAATVKAGVAYDVTDDTKEALTEFMPMGKATRWNEHITEMASPVTQFASNEAITVCISGVSMQAIVQAIYGKVDAEKKNYQYSVSMATVIPATSREFIMQIAQLDTDTVAKLRNTLNISDPRMPTFHYYRG